MFFLSLVMGMHRYSYDRTFPAAVFSAVWGHLPDKLAGDRRKTNEDKGSGQMTVNYEITGEDREGNSVRIDLGVMVDDTPEAVIQLGVFTDAGFGDFGPKGTGYAKNLVSGNDEEFLARTDDPDKAAHAILDIIRKVVR